MDGEIYCNNCNRHCGDSNVNCGEECESGSLEMGIFCRNQKLYNRIDKCNNCMWEDDGVEGDILDPRHTYEDKAQWHDKAVDLAKRFVNNFEKFTDTDNGKSLVKAGPLL